MKLTHDGTRWVWQGGYKTRWQPKSAGFRWSPSEKVWWTEVRERAYLLRRFADGKAKAELGTFTQETMPYQRREAILLCLKMLADVCDGARKLDGVGFSKSDTSTGRTLARKDALNSEQAEFALSIIRIHQHQLPRDLLLLAGAVRRDRQLAQVN